MRWTRVWRRRRTTVVDMKAFYYALSATSRGKYLSSWPPEYGGPNLLSLSFRGLRGFSLMELRLVDFRMYLGDVRADLPIMCFGSLPPSTVERAKMIITTLMRSGLICMVTVQTTCEHASISITSECIIVLIEVPTLLDSLGHLNRSALRLVPIAFPELDRYFYRTRVYVDICSALENA